MSWEPRIARDARLSPVTKPSCWPCCSTVWRPDSCWGASFVGLRFYALRAPRSRGSLSGGLRPPRHHAARDSCPWCSAPQAVPAAPVRLWEGLRGRGASGDLVTPPARDLCLGVGGGAAVVDDPGGAFALVVDGELGGEAGSGFGLRELVPGAEAGELGGGVAPDDEDALEAVLAPALEEQGDVHDHQRRRRFQGGHDLLGDAGADTRMGDRLETAAAGLVAEDDGTEGGAIEAAVRREHGGAELRGDLRQRRHARLDDLPGEQVGVDDRRAPGAEQVGDCALSRGDAAGEADEAGEARVLRAASSANRDVMP